MLHIIKMYKGMILGLMESRLDRPSLSQIDTNKDAKIDAREWSVSGKRQDMINLKAKIENKGEKFNPAGESIDRILNIMNEGNNTVQKAAVEQNEHMVNTSSDLVRRLEANLSAWTSKPDSAKRTQEMRALEAAIHKASAANSVSVERGANVTIDTPIPGRDFITEGGVSYSRTQLEGMAGSANAQRLLAKMNGSMGNVQAPAAQAQAPSKLNPQKYSAAGIFRQDYVTAKIKEAKVNYHNEVVANRNCPPDKKVALENSINYWTDINKSGLVDPNYGDTRELIGSAGQNYGEEFCPPEGGECTPEIEKTPPVKPVVRPPVEINFQQGECTFDGIYQPRETVTVERGASIQQIANQIKNVPAGYSLIRTHYGDNYYAVSQEDMSKIKITSSGFLDSTWSGNPRGLTPILNQGDCKPVYQINVIFTGGNGNGNGNGNGPSKSSSTTTGGGGKDGETGNGNGGTRGEK